MAIELTNEQKNAVYGKGTILVYAAAGSGKTAVLSKRVIERVCDANDKATIDRLLIVTFTNASALEMRTRIAKELDIKAAENPGNTYILKQKLLLKNAKICTIDSFCIDLVRKNFGVLGISPDFAVATKADTAYLSERAIKSVLARHFKNPDKDFINLCDSFNIYTSDLGLSEAITDIYDAGLCMSKPHKWFSDILDSYSNYNIKENLFADIIFNDALSKLELIKEQFNLIIREAVNVEHSEKIIASFSEAIEYVQMMIDAASFKEWDRLYELSCNYKTPYTPQQKQWSNQELYLKVKAIKEKCKKSVDSIKFNLQGTEVQFIEQLKLAEKQIKILISLVREYSEEYYNLLIQNNILSFGHIEQLALKLLCTEKDGELLPSELSKEICQQYDEVLVDEYQDNNDLQDALFYAVSDSGKHLFLVGDVKQSIYGFRNASPDNFLKYKNSFPSFDGEASPSKVILSANFRSRKGICDFVNGICGALMQKKTSGLDYDDEERLVARAKYPKNNTIAAEICLNNCPQKLKNETDAEVVADYIVKTMTEEPFLRDGESGLRKAKYSDFAILLRSPGSKVTYYTDALKKRGIPVSYNVGDFYNSAEVLTAISILKVIDNPSDDIALLSSLTSVAFGFSFDEIADLKIKYKKPSLYANVILAFENGNRKCEFFLETLNTLGFLAVSQPISKFINIVFSVTHLVEIMSAGKNGEECRSNLMLLKSIADDYTEKGYGSLSGFIAYFERLAKENLASEKTTLNSGNAVKIMSFHGSKGLQFPICIVAGLGSEFNKTDLNDKMIISKSHGLGINIVCDKVKYETSTRKALRIIQSDKLISEELRLLYVALTRAEERVMLSITSTDCRKDIVSAAADLGLNADATGLVPSKAVLSAISFKSMILSAALLQKSGDKLGSIADVLPIGADGCGDFKLYFRECFDLDENIVENEVETESKILPNPEIINLVNERFSFKYPYQSETEIPSKMAVTSLVHGEKSAFAFKRRPRFMSKAGLTPAERGTAMHKVMQYIDFQSAENDLSKELERLYEYEFLSDLEYESINTTQLENFFKGKLYHRLKSADKLMREYKFMVEYPYNGSKTIIQGIADCIFFEDGKAVIVDFKTDNVNDMSTLKERYSEQLEIYKNAISEIFSVEVKECIIYSLQLNDEIVF